VLGVEGSVSFPASLLPKLAFERKVASHLDSLFTQKKAGRFMRAAFRLLAGMFNASRSWNRDGERLARHVDGHVSVTVLRPANLGDVPKVLMCAAGQAVISSLTFSCWAEPFETASYAPTPLEMVAARPCSSETMEASVLAVTFSRTWSLCAPA
jgi:hypothetical protein